MDVATVDLSRGDPGDPRYLRLIGPNQWPTALPELRAAVHRVLSPPGGRDRFSAAFFLAPRLDAVVGRWCKGGVMNTTALLTALTANLADVADTGELPHAAASSVNPVSPQRVSWDPRRLPRPSARKPKR